MRSSIGVQSISFWLERLSRPSSQLTELEEQFRARLLSLILLLLTVTTAVGSISWVFHFNHRAPDLIIATAILSVLYLISRTQHFSFAGIAAVITLSGPSFVPFIMGRTVDLISANIVLFWLAVPLLIAGLVLPIRRAIAMIFLIMVCPSLVGYSLPNVALENVVRASVFLSVLGCLTIVSAIVFYLSRRAIHEHFLERHRVESELQVTQNELELRVEERTTALVAMNEMLQALVESSPAAVIITDHTQNVILWNPAATQIFGWTPEEIIGQPNPIVTQDDDTTSESLFDLSQHGPLVNVKIVVLTKSGAAADVSLSTAPLRSPAGDTIGIIGILLDLREHKRLEQQLLHAQKMDAIGQLAGGVAHDFNNLLTVINGYTDVLLEECAEGEPFNDDLKAIRDAGKRAETLTRQLLAFGRRQVLRFQVIDLNELLDGIGKMLRRLIHEDVTLELKLSSGLGFVEADPGQLEQVVVNLVINACDAMPQGGTLTIETKNENLEERTDLQLGGTELDDVVALTVADTGCGMSEEVRERLFEPFFTTKAVGRGTGLGLSMVYGIVTQSKGIVSVESELGKGSSLTIFLPRVKEEHNARHSTDHPSLPQGKENILVVEDEDLLRDLTTRMLASLGYNVLSARNGVEAITIHRESAQAIHLVLSDVVMPEMRGPESIERMREHQPHLPVLYMSGHINTAYEQQKILDSDAPLLEKPFTIEQLATAIREIFDSSTYTVMKGSVAEDSVNRQSNVPRQV